MSADQGPVGLGFLGGPALSRLVELGKLAERHGFESLWHAETRITRDSVTAMTALLLATERVRVGSAAINVYTRGAALTAITWAALAEAAPGRVVLGVGPGSPLPLGQQGYGFDFPVSRLAEFAEAVRAAWTEPPPISYGGRFTRFEGLAPEVQPGVVPAIYFCVTGPRALDRAGQMSDGVVLNAFMPPSYVAAARRRLDAGAGGEFTGEIAGSLVTAMAGSVREAAARVRPILANYLVHFPDLARETGLQEDFLEHLRRRAAEGGLAATFSELPDDLVAQHAVVGPEDACRERLAAYRQAGLQLPVLFPDPDSEEQAIRQLGPD